MSEQIPTADLLEGLILGEPISVHHGVRCHPAIDKDSDERFIVKVISIPASQSQLDALLLTGACADEVQALSYFEDLAKDAEKEAHVLQHLSELEGFDGHQKCQIKQLDSGIGYEVYLLAPYRSSLANLMHREPLTHLAAVNLGLDLCAALTACRRLGYLYVDLKPENIFFTENQGYRIGDLGFLPLTSLPYASLPEKYRSCYTAPEVSDAMSSLNDTMDIYAVGLILYQVFHNGKLPFEGFAPAKPLDTPAYADYEMAEIILKACAPDPKDRWQDPAQMGQALVNYMQRNSVNATPIIPPPIVLSEPEEKEAGFLTEEENDAQMAPLLAALPDEVDPEQLAIDGSTQSLATEDVPEAADTDTDAPTEADKDQLSFLDDLTNDETAPSHEASAVLEDTELTEEVAEMLALADVLIAHELPEPVVAPGPIDVPIPPLVVDEPEAEENAPIPVGADLPAEEVPEEEPEPDNSDDEYIKASAPRRKAGRWIAAITAILLLLALAIGGYIWYQEVYLQNIDGLTVQGEGNQMTVTLVTGTDEKLLSVVCIDTYGNTLRSPVVGGVASFHNLTSGTQYRIKVEISGLHKLTGNINAIYTTDGQTEILDFTAVCGPEDGSVILRFSANGNYTGPWTVRVCAPGEAELTQEFTEHTVTIYGLKPGTEYTFRLEGNKETTLAGQTETVFIPQKVLCAQNLQVADCGNGSLTVQWTQPDAPAGQVWLLRCYNGSGYDKSVTTTDLTYTFTDLDHSTGYTILVTAEGMTQSASTSVTANPIRVERYTGTATTPYALHVEWEFTGTAPENGWVLTYRVNGGDEFTVSCMDNRALLALVSGGIYEFTARPADDITCFTQSGNYTAEETATFEGFGITAQQLNVSIVQRPENENWGYSDLTAESYKTAFDVGENAALLLTVGTNFALSGAPVEIVFSMRNDAAELVSAEKVSTTWNTMWTGIHCPLNLSGIPQEPGSYTLDLYFNDLLVATLSFSVI